MACDSGGQQYSTGEDITRGSVSFEGASELVVPY
jgi:hypothetical protein